MKSSFLILIPFFSSIDFVMLLYLAIFNKDLNLLLINRSKMKQKDKSTINHNVQNEFFIIKYVFIFCLKMVKMSTFEYLS